jgi:hypothetical protein
MAVEAGAQGLYLPVEGSTHFEGRYRSLGDGAFQAGAAVRFWPGPHVGVGWRIAARDFPAGSAPVQGRHITVGPLWGYTTTTRLRLRFEAHPWLALHTTLMDGAGLVAVKLPYGADASLHVYLPLHLGAAVVLPGAKVTGHGARSTLGSEPPVAGWDWGAGWSATLAVSLGKRSPLTFDAGYSRPRRAATHLGDERWTCGVAWSRR